MEKIEKLTIIDMDTLFYFSSKDTLQDSIVDFKNRVLSIVEKTQADKVVSFITKGRENFRYKIYPEYKGNRLGKEIPKYVRVLSEVSIADYKAVPCIDIEADDACILMYNQYKDKYDITIAAIDSDLRQVPAKFYDYKKDIFEQVLPPQAELNLWKSVLAGKGKDNVKGLEGCGEETANSYLNEAMEAFALKYKDFAYDAYVYGIDKTVFKDVFRNVKGNNLLKGTRLFNLNLHLCKLLANMEEVEHISNLIGKPLNVGFLTDPNVFMTIIRENNNYGGY